MASALALGLLAGCGGGSDDDKADTSPAPSAPGPAAGDDRAATLKKAAQGYVDALMKGQYAGVVGYLDPRVCDDDDETSYALTVGQIKDLADGATMKVASVKIDGDHGGVKDYTLSDGAPDQLRRLIKASFEESKKFAWNYRDGEWYIAGPCEDDASASPTP